MESAVGGLRDVIHLLRKLLVWPKTLAREGELMPEVQRFSDQHKMEQLNKVIFVWSTFCQTTVGRSVLTSRRGRADRDR